MDSKNVKDKAVNLISAYLGEVVAKSYGEFYSNKDVSIVKVSVNELLSDYLGEKKAKEILIKHGINKAILVDDGHLCRYGWQLHD